MWELFTANQNLPFSVALTLMIAIALLEGVTAVFGVAVSELVDTLVPDLDGDLDVDLEVDLEADAVGGDVPDSAPALSQLLGWLRVGEVPVLILFIIFLMCFSLGGFATQSVMHGIMGSYLSPAFATLPALAIALPALHFVGGLVAAILPRDETEAVAEASFVGRDAQIVLGTARAGSPAQAKLQDEFGKTHYIMFEPIGDESVTAGSIVTLQEKRDKTFRGVPAERIES